ncbi:adenylate/guanylate cyclase domain-containing protein [Bradyrhizobium centrosematis]|uniref:adenylate/guanylate cyclase domain-containing protein n=1 Tax=Bradyrhizobium centrosematis TaxID=1300039 RepID=UPI00216740A5|nr:adenylate/guanylate cyclase domain-containing protein [Bradyrhizobium centrosematis]MCS3764973.1 adenylate cyclase [Bradyrhizobium centrosematis]MCS3777751.1 adenylate cyclase [Bradyrhizobium centrosematis]
MAEDRVERRLAAVLAADVAGYSRLMGADEEGTLTRLKAIRKGLIDLTIAKHRGRIVKTTGDGMLVEFASVVDAVRGAVEVQRGIAERGASSPQNQRIQLRIGIHVGDIIIDDNDIFGDGVNIAARLEGIAEPGGVCISDDAYRQVRGKVEIGWDDVGPRSLKNIAEPVQVWRMRLAEQISNAAQSNASRPHPLPLPDKPSVAVLPFTNMSGDPEQEYFADGMVEDIITELSRFRGLFVIARNSSFTYKGRAVDIKQVGRELGVRYVLEGSVRKSGQRVRITGQLIEADSGAHLWGDKFESDLHDAFELQDKVTESVVGAIAPRLVEADMERARRKPPESWDSYDYYLRGLAFFSQRNVEANERALPLFLKAVDLNPTFGLAYTRAAACLSLKSTYQGQPLTDQERSDLIRLNDRALELEPGDAFVMAWGSLIIAFTIGDMDRGSDYVDRALAINPNLSNAWNARGWISACLGDGERSLEAFDHSIRLNPFDDWTVFIAMRGKCASLYTLGRYEDALEQTKKLAARAPNDLFVWFYRWMISGDPTICTRFPNLHRSDLKRLFVEPVRRSPLRVMLEEAIDRLQLAD